MCIDECTGDILALFEVDREDPSSGITRLAATVRARHRAHRSAKAQRPVGDCRLGECIGGEVGDSRVGLSIGECGIGVVVE